MSPDHDRSIRLEIHNLLDTYCGRCTARLRSDNKICRGCDIYPDLRALGDSLLTGWRGSEVEAVLQKGEDLTVKDIRYLLSLGTSKKDIAAALGISTNRFNHFILENRLRHRDLVEDGYLQPVGGNRYVSVEYNENGYNP